MKVKPEPKVARRIIAATIDYVLYFILIFAFIFLFGDEETEGQYFIRGWLMLVPIVIWIVYFPFLESISGRTPGKYILGLKVVTKTGKDIDLMQAFQRHLLDITLNQRY